MCCRTYTLRPKVAKRRPLAWESCVGEAWTCRMWQRVYKGPHMRSPVVLGHIERMGQDVVQELDHSALPYLRNSRILNSICPSNLLGRDVCRGRSIGGNSVYILIYLHFSYVAPQMLETTLDWKAE